MRRRVPSWALASRGIKTHNPFSEEVIQRVFSLRREKGCVYFKGKGNRKTVVAEMGCREGLLHDCTFRVEIYNLYKS